MAKKVIISESQLRRIISEDLTKDDVNRIVTDLVKHDKGIEVRVKDIAADVIKNLFRTLWQRNNLYDSDIRR